MYCICREAYFHEDIKSMMNILWQTAAAVANGTIEKCKLKFFEMRSTKCNENSLFAENKLCELYNLHSENKGLTCGEGLMPGEILNSSCLNIFWKRLFEVVFILKGN